MGVTHRMCLSMTTKGQIQKKTSFEVSFNIFQCNSHNKNYEKKTSVSTINKAYYLFISINSVQQCIVLSLNLCHLFI